MPRNNDIENNSKISEGTLKMTPAITKMTPATTKIGYLITAPGTKTQDDKY